jgi:hypothetical protein
MRSRRFQEASVQRKAIASHQLTATPVRPETSWRDRPLLPLRVASEVIGVSISSLYNYASEGRLKLRTLAGRTLVDTPSLIALAESAADWVPSERGKEARAKRTETALSAWRS